MHPLWNRYRTSSSSQMPCEHLWGFRASDASRQRSGHLRLFFLIFHNYVPPMRHPNRLAPMVTDNILGANFTFIPDFDLLVRLLIKFGGKVPLGDPGADVWSVAHPAYPFQSILFQTCLNKINCF